jgi:hypothetical protein
MAIDNFMGLSELNIKDLVNTEPFKKTETPFDPSRDISDKAWSYMQKALNSGFTNMGQNQIEAEKTVTIAARMKLLDGKGKSHPPRMNERDWDIINTRIVRAKSISDWKEYLGLLAGIRIFDPERSKNEKYQINSEIQYKIITDLNTKGMYNVDDYFIILANNKIVSPDLNIEIADSRWTIIQNELEKFSNLMPENKSYKFDRDRMIYFVNKVKIIDQEKGKLASLKLNISWNDVKNDLQELEKKINPLFSFQHNTFNYINDAFNLLLLSAESIKVTENGLELEMPEAFQTQDPNPPLPDVRRF